MLLISFVPLQRAEVVRRPGQAKFKTTSNRCPSGSRYQLIAQKNLTERHAFAGSKILRGNHKRGETWWALYAYIEQQAFAHRRVTTIGGTIHKEMRLQPKPCNWQKWRGVVI